MKWLALLNDTRIRTLYFSGVICSFFYSSMTIYFYVTEGEKAVNGQLNMLILLLLLTFVLFDTSRFSAFFSSKKVRLLPLKSGKLYLINLLLSMMNGLFFMLINWGVVSVAHLIIFQSVDVPKFEIDYLKDLSFWFVILSFYILIQFFMLMAQVAWQQWFPKLSKRLLPIIFLILLVLFLFSQQAIPASLLEGNFPEYLAILVALAMGISVLLVDKYLEDE